jgi:hypothetical protein
MTSSWRDSSQYSAVVDGNKKGRGNSAGRTGFFIELAVGPIITFGLVQSDAKQSTEITPEQARQ